MKEQLWRLVQRGAAWDRALSARIALPAEQHGRPWLTLFGAHLGDSWLWALIVGWLLLDSSRASAPTAPATSKPARPILAFCLSLLLQIILTLGIKQVIRRPRPRQAQLLYGGGADAHSFPSGHAMRMTVIGAWGSQLWPSWGWLLWPLSGLVGWCRVRLAVHYVGDVLAGTLLGWLIVALVRGFMPKRS